MSKNTFKKKCIYFIVNLITVQYNVDVIEYVIKNLII